jgi:GTP-binding protein HflX
LIEKCVIAGVKIKQSRTDIDYEMDELKQLVEASGGMVVYSIVQEKDNYTASTYLGKGKVEEIRILCEEAGATLVVVNDELTGSQINNLEKMLDVRVIDRTMLILDIFALRAKTKESKLQVELAQLKYTMPRLKGKGIEMSKLGGGIGTRGPGEKKLETDRRHIESNIHEIEKQLKKAKTVREVNRKSRIKNNVPVIAVIGYTNAGKSTLINALLNLYGVEKDKEVFVYDMLFATLTTENRKLKILDKYEAVITDTVGFISKLPTKLIESFKSTLEEINFSDIIIHLMDVTNEDLNVQKDTTDEILKEIKATDIPVIEVYNKIDKADVSFEDSQGIYISAKTGLNMDKLVERILHLLYGESKIYHIKLGYSDHVKLSFLENNTNIIEREYLGDGINVVFETREKIYEKL